ncbi:uncharacterized protein BYT42DRAFT_346289 [Radiomyces spectabilis]|uniref:uncharacterized protein n=1 Tax=Radiomyces spectabilis TaxID=64574 RepID=UPI00221E80FB|nr:uncharacterized protein BYT42DRAFT_346289 [Radiomyces spectabilis]KAI8377491.1 hypothetical protein BYT42DRAFT_346289 [Radiomyces spectabilis]
MPSLYLDQLNITESRVRSTVSPEPQVASPTVHSATEKPRTARRTRQRSKEQPSPSLPSVIKQLPGRPLHNQTLKQDPPPKRALRTSEDQEKEYWRRQRRIFVRSRCITRQEALDLVQSVYRRSTISDHDPLILRCQSNMSSFRSKWRTIIKQMINSREWLALRRKPSSIASKIDRSVLETIWGPWICAPYVKKEAFYKNTKAVKVLTEATAKAIEIALRYHGATNELNFRKEMDSLDPITRNLPLPDPLL